ncbi:hypothetical protein OG730_01125 [Streptomyces sp. NBC_01298]|nr:hypothetical protein OG730_01125 [Streptomyces sp. NBC_01298]
MFADPADEILRRVRERGWTVTSPDAESLVVPVAGADYYDFLAAS